MEAPLINLLLFSPNPTDATSFYRCIRPFQVLKRQISNLHLVQSTDVNWASISSADLVFMQRPFTPNHLKIADMVRANEKPLWVDYDDDLFSVPRSNRTWKTYGDPAVQNCITSIVAKADIISVSTEHLKQVIGSILWSLKKKNAEGNLDPAKIIVLPNAYDSTKFQYAQKPKKPEQSKLLSWRGSDTHDKDMLYHTDGLVRSFGKHLDWTLNFVGSPFWYTIEMLDNIPGLKPTNVIETEPLDPIEYFKFMWMTAPALVIVPLWDCMFNRSKSNIAWIEATHAGAVCLAPEWEEWNRPGVITYKDAADFETKLDLFMRGEFDGKRLHAMSKEFIDNNLTVVKANEIRIQIIERLLEKNIETQIPKRALKYS